MSPAVVNHLKGQRLIALAVFTADVRDDVVAARLGDGHFVVPRGDAPGYADRVLDIVRRHDIAVVVPWSDEEAYALARVADEFRTAGATVLASPRDCLELIADKEATYRHLAAAKIAVPEYRIVEDAAAFEQAAKTFGYPKRSIVVKPVKGRGGRGMVLFEGHDSPAAWIGSGARERRVKFEGAAALGAIEIAQRSMVMPLLRAPVYDVDVLAHRGRCMAVVPRLRTNPTGIPFQGNRIVANAVIEDYVNRIASALSLDALHDIDVMTDDQGEPRLLEVNPRPSGSLIASLVAGVPLLEAAIAKTQGLEIDIPRIRSDIDVARIDQAVVTSRGCRKEAGAP